MTTDQAACLALVAFLVVAVVAWLSDRPPSIDDFGI